MYPKTKTSIRLRQAVLAAFLAGVNAGVYAQPEALPANLKDVFDAAWARQPESQALLMRLLPGEPLMSTDNLDSMRVPSIATPGAPGLKELGIDAQALEAVAPTYLGPGQGDARLDRWRAQR